MLDEVTVIMSRLNDMLQEIGGIGRNEDGSITRLGASEGYFQALEQVKMRMEALGMKAEQDPVGNLHGISLALTRRPSLLYSDLIWIR